MELTEEMLEMAIDEMIAKKKRIEKELDGVNETMVALSVMLMELKKNKIERGGK